MDDHEARTRKAAPDERVLRFQSLQAGSLFASRYRIIERIGSGEVYRVHDRIAEAEVALKVLYPGSGSSDLERLRRELRLVRELRDPGIVRTHDIGSADGFLFTVSELLNGESLRERLERSAPLPPAKAKTILRGILSALSPYPTSNPHLPGRPGSESSTGATCRMRGLPSRNWSTRPSACSPAPGSPGCLPRPRGSTTPESPRRLPCCTTCRRPSLNPWSPSLIPGGSSGSPSIPTWTGRHWGAEWS